MKEKTVQPNSLRAWMLASRPKTLTGAAVPVMIGLSLAYVDVEAGLFKLVPAVLCVLFAFIMQIDANFINDYFDFVRGNDDETRLGPRRACAQGWISEGAMKKAIIATTLLACVVGLPVVLYGGFEMILVGLLCVLFCFLYTTTLSYLGMGDLLVIVFFGIVPVCATYYIQTYTVSFEAFMASLACGFVIDTLLLVNNYRDIDNDRRAGKITLVVRMGADNARIAYLVSGLIAVLLGVVFLFFGHRAAFCLPVLYLAFHFLTYRKMVHINKGKALNLVLGDTARNMFIYGLLVSIGILLDW
ncbi:MAG: 1,4-dihydroxy-2-naphthoate octaprenyltransferase [Prevotellaceae bacterium]|nr:1,4-dihydroxy-2-naphthoate octaprenyltransferase [Prevotellaceae bacterium]